MEVILHLSLTEGQSWENRGSQGDQQVRDRALMALECHENRGGGGGGGRRRHRADLLVAMASGPEERNCPGHAWPLAAK